MKAIIIDDEPVAIEALESRLTRYKNIELAGKAQTGEEGINLLKDFTPDLLFLDVELPDMTGLDFLEQKDEILKGYCQVVMYTAHNDYMLPAFRNDAFDFLQKPVNDAELDKVMQHFFASRTEQKASSAHIRKPSEEKILFYTNSVDFRVVNIRDIGLFQYNRELRLWEVVVAGRRESIKLKRSANYETLLDIDSRFVQVSQRFIININYLLEVCDNYCLFYPPFNHIDYVNIGRMYRRKLIERFCTL